MQLFFPRMGGVSLRPSYTKIRLAVELSPKTKLITDPAVRGKALLCVFCWAITAKWGPHVFYKEGFREKGAFTTYTRSRWQLRTGHYLVEMPSAKELSI